MGALISKRINGKHKNNKFKYYLQGYFDMWLNTKYSPTLLFKKTENYEPQVNDYIRKRVNYYNKLEFSHQIKEAVQLSDFRISNEFKTYHIDFSKFIKFFPKTNRCSYEFGDVTHIPFQPTIVKSRPIFGANHNSILLNLNKIRHFNFVNDSYPHNYKLDKLVWRGKAPNRMPNRQKFLKTHIDNPLCNIGAVNQNCENNKWLKPRMTIDEQLQYKFILSLEGNDVATNLKWIMSSNSIAVMPKPTYETWFMEGTLIPDYHYICIKPDYSDLNEKLSFYLKNPDKSQEIIINANAYVDQFKNKEQEELISLLVLDKYFKLVN